MSTAILYESRCVLNHKVRVFQCSLTLPYITHCVEVWEIEVQNTRRRYCSTCDYDAHADTHLLKFKDLVFDKTMHINVQR